MNLTGASGLLHSLSLSTSAILNLLVVLATHVMGVSSGALPLSTLCTSNTCRNGQCYAVGTQAKCACDVTYRGEKCQNVNLDIVTYTIIATVVVFKWPEPPRLKGYSFVYYQANSDELLLLMNQIAPTGNDNAVIVGDLENTNTLYTICLEDNSVAEMAIATKSTSMLHNCVDVHTHPDYHTLAGYFIWVLLCGIMVLIMYWQRDKIEFLYFHKPGYYYERPQPAEEEEEGEQEQSVTTQAEVEST